jgi:hypothetical protein
VIPLSVIGIVVPVIVYLPTIGYSLRVQTREYVLSVER